MRANVPEYALLRPASLPEALRMRAEGWAPIAGGTDLMVLFQSNRLAFRRLMDISKLNEFRAITESADYIALGALTTFTGIREHALLQSEFNMLCQAASWTGGIANQNRATLGGNIANASPAADSSPALLVYNARLTLISERGVRTAEYNNFHTGYKKSILAEDELILAIELPRPRGPRREYIRKVGTRRAQAVSKICFAGLKEGDEVRIALGSVAPTPVRCPRTEQAIVSGESATPVFLSEIAPIDDIRSTAEYRRRVSANLLEEFLRAIA